MSTGPSGHALVAALALLALSGCRGGDADRGRELQTSHLRSLISAYNDYGSSNGRPPDSAQQFKKFIEQSGGPMLQRLQLDSAEELFVSDRDGLPFVVLYGKRPAGVSENVVAYEQTGAGGKRLVGFDLGMIQELDEVRFRKLVPAGAEKP